MPSTATSESEFMGFWLRLWLAALTPRWYSGMDTAEERIVTPLFW